MEGIYNTIGANAFSTFQNFSEPTPSPATIPPPSDVGAGANASSAVAQGKAGESKEEKEKRKADKKQRKEEKRLAKALKAARKGLEGAAGGDSIDEDASSEDEAAEASGSKRKSTEGEQGVTGESGDVSVERSSKRSKGAADADGGKIESKNKSDGAAPRSKGKGKAIESAVLGGEDDELVDDEKLQELANAVVSGAMFGYDNGGEDTGDQVQTQPQPGDEFAGFGEDRSDVAQRVQGFDTGVLDPRLADIDFADWNTKKVAEEAMAALANVVDQGADLDIPGDSSSFLGPAEVLANVTDANAGSPPPPPPPPKSRKTKGKGNETRPLRVGPSVPGPPPRASAATNEFAAPKRKKRNEDTAPKDDELINQFKIPGEMERFLADRWLPSSELIRLEQAGIIAYKKGKFDVEEVEAITKHVEDFKTIHQVSDADYQEMVIALGKKTEHPRFWNDIALVVPGRPVRFVQKYVKRVYDPRARQGPWSKDEDKALEQACFATPGQWKRISGAVGRTEDDCRTRWRDELRHRSERERGRWSKQEEKNLTDIVIRLNTAAGKDPLARDAPWESVVKEMGGTRTTMQCRKKWHDQLMPSLKKADGERDVLHKRDRIKLVDAIKARKYAREEHIDFPKIAIETFGMEDYHPVRAMWRRIKAKVDGVEDLSLEVMLGRMRTVLSGGNRFKTPGHIESDGEEEEEVDEPTDNDNKQILSHVRDDQAEAKVDPTLDPELETGFAEEDGAEGQFAA